MVSVYFNGDRQCDASVRFVTDKILAHKFLAHADLGSVLVIRLDVGSIRIEGDPQEVAKFRSEILAYFA